MAYGDKMSFRWRYTTTDPNHPGEWQPWNVSRCIKDYVKSTEGTWVGVRKVDDDPVTTEQYWKLCTFTITAAYWSLQFEMDVTNGWFDTNTYETKIIKLAGTSTTSVDTAAEIRDFHGSLYSSRGYGNNISFTRSGSNVTVYILSKRASNETQYARLNKVVNQYHISNLTWYNDASPANPQPSSPWSLSQDIDKVDADRVKKSTDSTSWSGDDTNIPTRAAVDAKLVNKATVFMAYYYPSGGSTTFAEIAAAFTDGKTVFLVYQDLSSGNGQILTMIYSGRYLNSGHVYAYEFFCLDDNYEITVACHETNGWGALKRTRRNKLDADTVDGYHIVVGSLGTNTNTIYIF